MHNPQRQLNLGLTPTALPHVNLDPREPFEIKRGDRIAQLAIMRVAEAVFEPCEDLPATDRGTGGFGSSGIGA